MKKSYLQKYDFFTYIKLIYIPYVGESSIGPSALSVGVAGTIGNTFFSDSTTGGFSIDLCP
ncbi:hypothetical protein [Paraclostridium sordellii]|uniref:hypothetical protein n=1 Tax=Paraclostridium sordellii TaxID=1505 RepID=UPI0030D13B31